MSTRKPGKPSVYLLISWALFVGWALLVLWASLDVQPFRPLVRLLAWDKLQHALAYALLTLFGGLALRTLFPRQAARCWLVALGFSVCYGAIVEVLQKAMTRSRTGDPLDLLADLVGAALVVGVALPLEGWWRR